jgi:leucyl-tRNA synthetase
MPSLGNQGALVQQSWPVCREEFLARETVTVVVQVNGKLRGSMELAPEASEEDVLSAARAHAGVSVHLEGKTVRRVIHVPGKLINLVVS